MNRLIEFAEKGHMPDALIRVGMRRLMKKRIQEVSARFEQQDDYLADFAAQLMQKPIAAHTDSANEQHYMLPPEFFETVLGPHLKYSCAYWGEGTKDLGEAEATMLAMTAERADLADGQEILELGCGWGSLSMWMATHFPHSNIVAVSNSGLQKEWIDAQIEDRGIANLEVITADMNDFEADRRFDRVVSVEMFEHMQNWDALLGRIAEWLEPEGRLFLHVFCHKKLAYLFDTDGASNWMGRHFFTGGMMPSFDLIDRFNRNFEVEERWWVEGQHYGLTAEAWLANMDKKRERIDPILAETYGDDAERWRERWRIFFMACAELFGYDHGREWAVAHYRLKAAS